MSHQRPFGLVYGATRLTAILNGFAMAHHVSRKQLLLADFPAYVALNPFVAENDPWDYVWVV